MRNRLFALILISLFPAISMAQAPAGRGLDIIPYLEPPAILNKRAPTFALNLFDGSLLLPADLKKKVVVINFWASWCKPCKEEAPILEAAWRKFKGKEVAFVGIAIQDTDRAARAFIKKYGQTYPSGLDNGMRIARAYGVRAIPETYFLNRNGVVVYRHFGTIDSKTISLWVERLLKGET